MWRGIDRLKHIPTESYTPQLITLLYHINMEKKSNEMPVHIIYSPTRAYQTIIKYVKSLSIYNTLCTSIPVN